ncbi:hypothetical protein AYO20_06328 [Fonsecaea nubica]|uniref:Alpha/beta hydrolase fold-3 domain-containing protein n=1 Tax=Fonsecaea nubica TaxID=856822 RepID=A0A178D012_9EURO|nr:hypothetical protein AYO20_06328 [Fonsecaea nubica]OAL34485.1 hypothetical protein AYO20_06328 [Fonsecaea nubica]
MANLVLLLLKHPLRTLLFIHTFFSQISLVLLRRLLLPHFPVFQSLRLQIQRAYLGAAALTFPDLTHRLPVGNLSLRRARQVDEKVPAYLIPGTRRLSDFAQPKDDGKKQRCVVLFAHGGGYARGEARMYINYLERWVAESARRDLDLAFYSVEYPLTTKASHPAQRNAFIQAYQYLLDNGVAAENIVFMGDSAGGGLCILAAFEVKQLNLPQPAATVLISPWIDMALKAYVGGNPAVESDYFVMANKAVPALVQMFIGDRPPESPEVNPLHRQPEELSGLSPQLIFTGGAEFARYDSEQWAQMCHSAGVESKLVIEWGQLHIYAMGSQWTDPAVRRKTDGLIIEWLKNHVAT